LCFLWGTNWSYICYVEESRPPLWSSGQSSWLHNGDVLCFLWGTNRSYISYAEESRPPLWSSGQSSWLQIQRFNSRHYQIFWEVVGVERDPLSLLELEFFLRLTASQPVRLGIGPPFWTLDQILSCTSFSSDNYFILRSKAPSLTRKRVTVQSLTSQVINAQPYFTVSSETVFRFCRLLRLAGTAVEVF
jgi:hypothetical protein